MKRFKHGMLRYLNPILGDMQAIWHARRIRAVFLTLGYNTALFNVMLKALRQPQVINMDGLEWQRTKYKHWHEKAWLRLNEWVALRIADTCIADHPVMADYLIRQNPKARVVTLAYGADPIEEEQTAIIRLHELDLKPYGYGLIIARPEPENQILEMVRAWNRSGVNWPLVILGNYKADNAYHRAVREASGPHIRFVGALYDSAIVKTLRFYAGVYLHGHTVGGTNPSLVEAMAAGRPILAHDNAFNRGVAGDGALYFTDEKACAAALTQLHFHDDIGRRAKERHAQFYMWTPILRGYQAVLENPRKTAGG